VPQILYVRTFWLLQMHLKRQGMKDEWKLVTTAEHFAYSIVVSEIALVLHDERFDGDFSFYRAKS